MATIGAIHYNWPGDLEDFVRRASEIGYETCEIRAGDIWSDPGDGGQARAEEIGELLARPGMRASRCGCTPWPSDAPCLDLQPWRP